MTPQAIYDSALDFLGTAEVVGSRHNEKIVQFFQTVGHDWVKDDETAWCAAFVGHVLEGLGLPSTRKLNARSYLDWGTAIPRAEAVQGDVCIFWRGSRNGWQGHVALKHADRGDKIAVLGGNQSNRVSIADYSADRLLGFRRAPGVSLSATNLRRPMLAQGDSGAAVKDLQRAVGADDDGIFGPNTRKAVAAFQRGQGLRATGIVDAATWAVIDRPSPDLRNGVADAGRTIEQTATATPASAAVGTSFSPAELAAIRSIVREELERV